jgi:autotransporter-associated beta strand protein
MKHLDFSRRGILPFALLSLLFSLPGSTGAELALLQDMVLDNQALLMPSSAIYGRAINGVSFQAEPFMTYGDYQYATWYHLGPDNEDVYLARRQLSGTSWEVMDTGANFVNGDGVGGGTLWDAHNVVLMGISGDGRIHLSWDHHGHNLRYMNTNPGAATSGTWNSSLLNPERSSLNVGGGSIGTLTYPQFTTDSVTGNMYFNYRTGGSGAGNQFIATFNHSTGLWNTPHEFINGTNSIFYSDPYGSNSNNRNAYVNGLDVDSTGRLHTTWTWRETATGSSNHDIMYAYSDDGGDTWRNNAGNVVGTVGSPMNMNSPGITIVPMNRGNTLMNQQTQAVDLDNRVHMIMWHKRDDAAPVTGFTTAPAAYFHYYRDPTTGVWDRTELPTTRAVGSRPDMAYDENGNLYVAYVSPGPGDAGGYYTNGDLVIATASKATGYEDWEIVYTDTRDFSGEPFIDQRRLLDGDIVSVFLQENSPITSATGSALHIMEFNKLANQVVWAGDDLARWSVGGSTDWDNDNNDVGEQAFENGFRVTFDDGAADFAVHITSPVAPSATTFRNSANDYTLTGAGIQSGPLRLNGTGRVTLGNSGNSFTGDVDVTAGTLALSGNANLGGAPNVNVEADAELNTTAATNGLVLNGQTLNNRGEVLGNVTASNNSTVNLHAGHSFAGNLTVQSNSLVTGIGVVDGNVTANSGIIRVGGGNLPFTMIPGSTLIDDFSDGNLSEYIRTTVNDGNTATNVTPSVASGAFVATYAGSSSHEQVVLLRDDVSLGVGETLAVDVAMATTGLTMDLGLMVSAIDNPTAVSVSDNDTRDTFNWASVSVRPSQDAVRVNHISGGNLNTAAGVVSAVEANVSGLSITRNSATQFVLGYVDANSTSHVVTTLNFSANNVGTALGFYMDVRSNGALGSFDNLRIMGDDIQVFTGELLTIDGNVVLTGDSVLELDVYDPTIGDLLSVAGEFVAAGTLAVSLEALAPNPALGDSFNVLDFSSASGGFTGYDLPSLSSGLAWNVSSLLTTGELEVVVDVDLDNDGDVDGRDFLLIQRSDPSLTSAWLAQYGDEIAVPMETLFAVVPEPTSFILFGFGLCTLPFYRRELKG